MAKDSKISAAFKKFLPAWAGGSDLSENTKPAMAADLSEVGVYRPLFSSSYTGEKNLGEMGPPKNYVPAYEVLRIRSWQAYYESKIAQTILKRYVTWMIGSGLKLQSEPAEKVLEAEGVEADTHAFSEMTEARFSLYKKSERSDWAQMTNLDSLAKTAYKNSIVGGDVLVIMRYVKGNISVQLIDGAHVQSPLFGTESSPLKLENGNSIINGIETSPNGTHIRYYVRNAAGGFDKVEARGPRTGMQMAFLVYGLKYRLDNNRGFPLIAVVLESLKKMERYEEATLGSAEERAKIPYSIEHTLGSTGENPLIQNMAKAFNADSDSDEIPTDVNGIALAKTVAATTNKTVINMPINSVLKSLESKTELYFKDFFTINAEGICATLEMPPSVAFSKYTDSFSASRAAIKDWENTLFIGRDDFADQFYRKYFNFWLDIMVLTNKIQAPGYLVARQSGNTDVLDSYRKARFVGPPVPHIDPLKEVKAEREKLGSAGKHLPMGTLEQSTESLNGGEASANLKQYAKELEDAEELGIMEPVKMLQPIDEADEDDVDEKKKK